MKKILSLLAIGLSLSFGMAHAETAQQGKMATCNADAKTKALTGDARKDFMKSCLSAAPAAAPAASAAKPESKMAACNKASAGKTGDDRKAFMSDCMKK